MSRFSVSSPPGTFKKIRVLIVDDSMFMRAAVKKILDGDVRFEVVGQARDGAEGVQKVLQLTPDVVTMDFNMPKMDGAAAVREIMAQRPTAVVMLSAHTHEGARETFEALAAGAVDFLPKPAGEVSADLSSLAVALVDKLIAAAHATPRVYAPVPSPRASRVDASSSMVVGLRVCVIGISTGGPAALTQVIPRLVGDIGSAIIVVQHMPAAFTSPFADRLDAQSEITVREAQSGDRPRRGLALVAPGDHHLELDDHGVIRITTGPEVNGCRPSVDVTMRHVARVFGRRGAGVVMTGMGRDGADGLAAIKQAGGVTCAQDRETSVVYGMPRAAIESGAAETVLPLDQIAGWLNRL